MSKDEYYLGIALAVAKKSTCLKRHYGCVIVKNDIIIATGYNGNPRGEDNCCETGQCKRPDAARYEEYEKCNAVHAEQNALIAAAGEDLIMSTVYLACEEHKDICPMNGKECNTNKCSNVMWCPGITNGWIEDKNPVPCNICMNMLKNARVCYVINAKSASEGDTIYSMTRVTT